MVNGNSENVRCEATHTFQELSTTDASIELDVVDFSSANIVIEKFIWRIHLEQMAVETRKMDSVIQFTRESADQPREC